MKTTKEKPFLVSLVSNTIPLLSEKQYDAEKTFMSKEYIIRPHFTWLPSPDDETVALHIDDNEFKKIPEGTYLIGMTIISKWLSPGYVGFLERSLGLQLEESSVIKMGGRHSNDEYGTISLFTHKMYYGPPLHLSI